MSGYRPGYSEHHSPMFDLGAIHGQLDVDRITNCPPFPPVGANPPEPFYRAMYDRGYHEVFDGAVAHSCSRCRRTRSAPGGSAI